jgi:hypothetical protein
MEPPSRESSFTDVKLPSGSQTCNSDIDTSGVDEAKLMRKIDWHVLPCICIMYLLAFLDRCVLPLNPERSMKLTNSLV